LGLFEVGFAYVLWVGGGGVLQVLGLGLVLGFLFQYHKKTTSKLGEMLAFSLITINIYQNPARF